MEVISPLTGNSNVNLIATLNRKKIVEQYRSELNMNVSLPTEKIDIYECKESGLKFYHPTSMAGDEEFYEELAKKIKNYYNKWKWEYDAALDYISPHTSLLEIGCGNGYFLKEVVKRNIDGCGLEFNDYAIRNARCENLNVKKESIQTHARFHSNYYDYVCAFQVFEHIPSIREVLEASIQALKPGGSLIFGVPNNDSFIFRENQYNTLNLPPHHILLWDPHSLKKLPILFPQIQLVDILFEPENKVFRSMCYKAFLEKSLGKNMLSLQIFRLTRFIVKNLLRRIIKFGPGPGVVAIYQKI